MQPARCAYWLLLPRRTGCTRVVLRTMKFGHVQILFRSWVHGVKRKRAPSIQCRQPHNPAVLVQAINQAASHFSGQLQVSVVEAQQHNNSGNQLQIVESQQQQLQVIEAAAPVHSVKQVEQVLEAFLTVRLLRDSILNPGEEEEESSSTGLVLPRPTSYLDYTLDIDYTASKVVAAVIEKCKLFQCLSVLYKEGCHQLLATLDDLHDLLSAIQGCATLDSFKEVLEEILLDSTKAYAFVEKVCSQAMSNSVHSLHAHTHKTHKTHEKFCQLSWRFHTHTVTLVDLYEKTLKDIDVLYGTERKQRLSYGVVTYLVPIHKLASRLRKKHRVVLQLTEVNGESGYKVELSHPRTWRSDDVGLTSRVESNDRGYTQILQAARVKIEKGKWGWEAAQDTVLITYDDLLVANVASIAGSLLRTKHPGGTEQYRTSIQVVGSSRIDLDLQNLFIKGSKDKDHVYLKCFVATEGEEVLAIYRYHRKHFHKVEGLLHIVGRGNQPGLRHVLVSIFSSLGFTSAV